MDEARISKLSKADDWIKLDFESQKEGSTFLSHGETTRVSPRNAIPGWLPASEAAASGAAPKGYDAAGRLLPVTGWGMGEKGKAADLLVLRPE